MLLTSLIPSPSMGLPWYFSFLSRHDTDVGDGLDFFVVVDILVSLDTFLYFFLSRQIDADGLDTGPSAILVRASILMQLMHRQTSQHQFTFYNQF